MMKYRRNPILRSASAAALGACLASPASAQISVKADNTTSLNLAGSWASGGVPTSTSTVSIATLSTSRTATLGDDLGILGLEYTSSFQFQIGATAAKTLTIGSGGVTKSAGTAALIFANAVTLGANQTWNISGTSTTGNLQMNGAFSDGGNTLAVTGAGTFDLRGSNTFGSNVTIDTTVSVNSAAATVVFGGTNTFNTLNVPAGRLEGATIGNFGVASNFGDGGTNTAIALGGNGGDGVMAYTGNTISTNRTVNRDARSPLSGIEVTTAGQTLIISGGLGTVQSSASTTNGWVFGGAGNLTLSGAVGNTAGGGTTTVTKNGSGTLTLGGVGNNTYSGANTINGGTLKIVSATALGFGGPQTTTTGSTTVNSGFTLDLAGTTGINEPIILSGTGIGGNGALINTGAAASISNGIAGLTIGGASTGSGYSAVPSVTISGTGSGATATATLGLTSSSASVNAAGDRNYTVAPTVAITGGGGSGATAAAVLSGGSTGTVIGYTITNPGSGYTTAPSVTISGGTSTGSTTTTFAGNATNFTVSGVTMTAPGSGYTGTPSYTFGSGNAAPGTATLSSVTLAATSSIGGAGDITINSAISESGGTGRGLTKVGNGTLTLGGANSYTGATVISGGTLLAAANNVIPSPSDLTLSGATYATGGFSNTARTLANSGTSVIDMGSGTSILTFGDSNGTSWAGTLTIWNWSGSLGGGGLDQIKFPSGGLSSGQVGAISFLNPDGLSPGTYGATLLSGGELVPVPEASTLVISGVLGFLPLLHRRRPGAAA